jgi:hypothetical protein
MPLTSIQTYADAHTCDDLALWNHNALVVVVPSIISLVLIFVAVMSVLGLALGCLLGWFGSMLRDDGGRDLLLRGGSVKKA